MRKLIIPVAAGAVSLALAACGSSNDNTAAPASQSNSANGSAAGTVLKSSVQQKAAD